MNFRISSGSWGLSVAGEYMAYYQYIWIENNHSPAPSATV